MSHLNNEKLRSCEQYFIKLGKQELEGHLEQFDERPKWLFQQKCVYLLHLIQVLSIPGQEEKIKVVQVNLNEKLHTMTKEVERYDIFKRYLSQRLKVKSNLTDKDLLTGQIDPQYEFELKLYYCDIFCAKNNNQCCKECLKKNANILVSNIEKLVINQYFSLPKIPYWKSEKNKLQISCNILLCLLNWNIFTTQTPVTFQNTETPAFSLVASVAAISTNYSYNAYKVNNILQTILSTLSEDDIFTVFNNYLDQMIFVLKSKITEDDFCIGKIEPYNEFLLKLCYFEKLWDQTDDSYMKFLKRNADFLVPQIKEVVDGNEIKLKLIYAKVLLCLAQMTTQIPSIHQNKDLQASPYVTLLANAFIQNTIRSLLQRLISVLSEDEMFTTFNIYFKKMHTMKSKVTEADFCTGKIEPYNEFLLKLCYFENLCYRKDDNETFREFLTRNADLFVSQIEKVVDGSKTETKYLSCRILMCLLNWNIRNQQSTFIQSILQNSEMQAPFSLQSEGANTTKNVCTAYKVRYVLENLLSTMTDTQISRVFGNFINQMNTMKSEITPDGLNIRVLVLHHEFKLKLCYWKIICSKNDYEAYEKFIQLYPEFLVSYIEEVVQQNETKTKMSFCKTLLCILNWNVYHQKTSTPLNFQDCSFTSKVKKTTKNQCTAFKVSLLQKILSTLSEDEIISTFNDYLEQMITMKSEITVDAFCTGKVEPFHEFMLKLCYFEKLWDTIDDFEPYREFLRKNAYFLVTQIEEVVHGNKTRTKHISCKILLCLLNWNICDLKSTLTQSKIQNSQIHASPSFQSEEEGTTKNPCTVYKVRCVLENLLSTLTDHDISNVFDDYIYQMYAMKSEITPDGLCIGETETHHEFKLKICYWETICLKNDYAAFKKFIQLYPEVLVSHIKQRIVLCQGTKTKRFSCRILLCILNWNICTSNTAPLLVQKAEIQASSSIDESPSKYLSTAETIRNILQHSLSTFSEEEILTLFNNYIDLLYAMNSEIAEADFCTGKIEPYHEFMMKLCYCEKLGNDDDDENYRKFLRRNVDFLVPQILEVVDKKNTKTKVISCQVLLCLLKWDICNLKTAYKPLKNIVSQMLSQNTDCQDFMNENALLFISMVHTVIKNNNIPVLITLCDVLLHIPYNTCHFQDVTGAINKLIRYYATQVGIDQQICEWIILLGHRLLKYTKHTQDIHNHIAAEETHYDFQMLKNFLSDLFTEVIHVGTIFDLLINAFRKETNLYGDYENKDGIINYDILNAEDDLINKLWRAKLTCKVKIIQISNNIRKKNKKLPFNIQENKNCLEFDYAQLNFIDTFEKEVEQDHVKVKILEDQIKVILIIDEMVKKFQLSKMLVLLMMLLIVGTSNGHHKSAKLKKYLTLKYEYDKASLYLLWCSGDIEVHPGPSLNKKSLAHYSSIKRTWIKNISPKIVVLLPEHEQSKYKPTKKVRNDSENREHFKLILKTCQEEQVHVPKMYLAEINAWETKEYHLLHKLFVYRCEIETIITSLQDFFICGGSTNDLTDINVSFNTELKTNEIPVILGNDHRPTDKSQLIVYITRHIAGIAIKCAHEKDPDAKCDGLWDLPLKNWPKQIILFDPNNRGKYTTPGQKLIPDQELVDMLLRLPQVTIPQKYKDIADAFRTMRKSQKDKSINKQHKAELCSTFKRITSLEKLDYAIKNLWESGIFTEEVHNNLNKWWTTRAVDTTDDQNVSQVNIIEVQKRRRPHVLINISTKSITLYVEQTDANSSHVSYDFPFSDELVPLKTMATTVHQTTTQKPSSDSYQMITVQKYFTVSSKQDACSVDNQTYSIIIPPLDLNSNSQAILESDIKHQQNISTEETALCSTIDFDQLTSSTKQISQLSKTIATPNQSTTNSDDISSATKNSQSLDFHTYVSPTSDLGSSDSISSVNSESGNDDGDQNNISNGGQVLLTDSDYSSNSSNNCVSKTNMQKRKFTEEDRNEAKKRKIPSQEDKKSKETNHRQMDCLMDNTVTFNKNREILPDWLLDSDLDSYDIDDQTFKVDLNALDNEDTELVKFLQDMINCESEKNVTNEVI